MVTAQWFLKAFWPLSLSALQVLLHLLTAHRLQAPRFQVFSNGVAGFLEMFGIPLYVAQCFMTMCVSALALTSLDAVARIGRMSFQELFSVDDMASAPVWRKVLCNKYFSTVLTLLCGFVLTRIGYANIWPLFGSANQLLSARYL